MALTEAQIASIEKLAASLKKWADEQPYSPPSKTLITLSPRKSHKDLIVLLSKEAPGLGPMVDKEFRELDEQVREHEDWRYKDITEENELDFRTAVDCLKGALYDLSETLTCVADLARDTADDIEGEHRTRPMSKKELAGLWGNGMTVKKITAMIKRGTLRADPQSRQTFIFDRRYLPRTVRDTVDGTNKT